MATTPDGRGVASAPAARRSPPEGGFASLEAAEAAIDEVARLALDELADPELDHLLHRLRRPLAQLEGVRARAAAVQQHRRLARRRPGSVDGARAEHRRELGRQQQLPPGEVARLVAAGTAAVDGTATGRAVTDGRVSVAHARTIGHVLATLDGEQREQVEAELVALAEDLDPVAFGRAARRVQARVQPKTLAEVQRAQQAERRFRATDTEDGGFAFSGLLHGSAAETARAAVQAFRRPDAVGEHRTPEQRGADAFEQLCAVALSAEQAPTRHGARPQVLVTIAADQLALLDEQPGSVAGSFVGSGQPVSGPELRHLLSDSSLVRVVLDADAVPIEVSTAVRTVPVGLWRALLIRDGGCTWPGCDAPASWCDVAHAITAFVDDGQLRLDNAMLLCRRHHRRYDSSAHISVRIDGSAITFRGIGDGLRRGRGDHGSAAVGAAPDPWVPSGPCDGGLARWVPCESRDGGPAAGPAQLELEGPDDLRESLVPP